MKYIKTLWNKDIRTESMTSFWCLYCWLWTYFSSCSSVSIVVFEHVFVCSLWTFIFQPFLSLMVSGFFSGMHRGANLKQWNGKCISFLRWNLTLFRMGLFEDAHGWVAQKGTLSKICHIYPTLMKIGTVIPYLNKIQKIHKSLDTLIEFCWHQYFFTEDQQLLVYQEIHV